MLTHEQPSSAHHALTGAQVCHGDTTEVEIAVGTMPSSEGNPHIAFCSATVRAKKVLKKGSWWDRRQPIAGDIVFSNGDEVAEKLAGAIGIAYMRGTVVTNGHVEFTIDPNSIRVVPVSRHEQLTLRQSGGQRLSQKVLAEVS